MKIERRNFKIEIIVINKLTSFLRKILSHFLFDKLLFMVSTCVENISYLYSDTLAVKQEKPRQRAWEDKFG